MYCHGDASVLTYLPYYYLVCLCACEHSDVVEVTSMEGLTDVISNLMDRVTQGGTQSLSRYWRTSTTTTTTTTTNYDCYYDCTYQLLGCPSPLVD